MRKIIAYCDICGSEIKGVAVVDNKVYRDGSGMTLCPAMSSDRYGQDTHFKMRYADDIDNGDGTTSQVMIGERFYPDVCGECALAIASSIRDTLKKLSSKEVE